MHTLPRESRDLVLRHDLDHLSPSPLVTGEPAALDQLAILADLAKRKIPGVNASGAVLTRFLRENPDSIFALHRDGRVSGGIAFLYLNYSGYNALLLGDIDLNDPSREYLARPQEDVCAIYVWALVCRPRAVLGLADVAAHLRSPRFREADYFARPETKAGRDLLVALGFAPAANSPFNLWRYQRPWKVLDQNVSAPSIQERSFADARH